MGDSSDALPEITGSKQTAAAPPKGASPSDNESADEVKKDAAIAIVEGEICRTESSVRRVSRNEDTLVVPCSTSQDSSDTSQILDQDRSSAAAPPTVEKWTNEAIAQRMQQRPARQDKLKRAGIFGDNPGFDYLQECWEDPSLRIVVKRLIVKFPQWRIACVDEKLVDWNET